MIKFINFIKRHIIWFALGNFLLVVGLVMLPVFYFPYDPQMMNMIMELSLFIQYIDHQSHSLTFAIGHTIVFIGVPTLFAVIGMILRKYRFTLAIPSLSYLILTFIMFGFPNKFRYYFIGFYLAILIFAFFLFYYIADIIVHRPPKAKAPKPKKPTTDERIAALEEEIEKLKNKKDDE